LPVSSVSPTEEATEEKTRISIWGSIQRNFSHCVNDGCYNPRPPKKKIDPRIDIEFQL
jgi:hypothetical protein